MTRAATAAIVLFLAAISGARAQTESDEEAVQGLPKAFHGTKADVLQVAAMPMPDQVGPQPSRDEFFNG